MSNSTAETMSEIHAEKWAMKAALDASCAQQERWTHAADTATLHTEACAAPKANDVQHGGRHYKQLGIEPWDYVAANGLGFFEGNAVKYLTRWRSKGGVEDLCKAQHYIDKLIELEQSKEAGDGAR